MEIPNHSCERNQAMITELGDVLVETKVKIVPPSDGQGLQP
jgi:hypothetical protein